MGETGDCRALRFLEVYMLRRITEIEYWSNVYDTDTRPMSRYKTQASQD